MMDGFAELIVRRAVEFGVGEEQKKTGYQLMGVHTLYGWECPFLVTVGLQPVTTLLAAMSNFNY
jgi:hypothetical protein